MKYSVMWRSRITPELSASKKHEQFVRRASALGGEWAIHHEAIKLNADFGSELLVQLRLKPFIDGVSDATVVYRYRSRVEDSGESDDFLEFMFSTTRVSYAEFVESAFIDYADAFDAYRAESGPPGLQDYDAEFDDQDSREGVFRIYPLSFYDHELCERSFGRSASECADLLRPNVELAKVVRRGLYVAISRQPMSYGAAHDVGLELRQILMS